MGYDPSEVRCIRLYSGERIEGRSNLEVLADLDALVESMRPQLLYADPSTTVATVHAVTTPTGIVASGGLLKPWPESVPDYMWDLWNRPSELDAMRQILDSLEDGSLKARLSVEWADMLGNPDTWSVSASRGGIRHVAPC